MTRAVHGVTRERTSEDNTVLQIARKVAATIGADFFRAIAKNLAHSLVADCVLIVEFVGGQTERCRTLAAYMDGEPATFEFELAGTVCAQIAIGKPCLWRSDAQTRFPNDRLLSEVRAQACIGVPLVDTRGRPIGALLALYRRPITSLRVPKSMLEIFAARASAELERKREDDQLRESEQRYRAFISRNADAMWRIEFEQLIPIDLPEEEQLQLIYRYGYLAECNDAMARLMGLERSEQLIGARIEEIAPSSNPSIMEANRIGIRSGYKLTTVETKRLDGQGQRKHILRSQWGIIEDGYLQRIWGSSRDITDLRHSEQALDASEQRISDLLEALPLLVIMLNPDGKVIFCNQYAYKVTGWEPAQIIGTNWLEKMIPLEERARLARDFARTSVCAGASIHFESTLLGADNRRFQIAWDSTTLRDAAGTIAARANIGRDITQHKALEDQFQQAQKLAGIGRLAGGVAHDFNNLLTVILGYSSGLLEKRKPSDPAYASLVEIRSAAQKAADLTSRLLAFSRRQVMRPEVMNLNTVIEDVLGMLRRLIGDNIRIVTELAPDLGPVRIDCASFHQVLMNLTTNSRDAMPRGGTLTISTCNVALTSAQTSAIPQGEYVRLTVTDNGIGMTREVRTHMFEPFFTTKATGRGTGLGLSAVYGIVQQSAGHVAVETEPGRGTTFHIYLPRVHAPLGSTPELVELSNLPGGPETILVVEDREDVRTLTVNILKRLGYVVLEADGPESALEVAGDGSRPIHLLLTDVVMPGMPVTEMAERLQAMRPNMKVLFVSGGGDDASVAPSGPGYLPKPFTPAELAGSIRTLLDEM
jgi:two-component system cell cycle sensor histidine kinase/response regulator CckA